MLVFIVAALMFYQNLNRHVPACLQSFSYKVLPIENNVHRQKLNSEVLHEN